MKRYTKKASDGIYITKGQVSAFKTLNKLGELEDKEEPKKLIIRKIFDTYDSYACPICNKSICPVDKYKSYKEKGIKAIPNYCSKCGQRVEVEV